MTGYTEILRHLVRTGVRFVVIGVGGANYYAQAAGGLFATQDRDLLLPPDPRNLLGCWQTFLAQGWELWSNDEPLDRPMDLWLAERVVEHRAAVTATGGEGLEIDLTLVMSGFSFDQVWAERRTFSSEGVDIPVARLEHIVQSKRVVGRPKDLLFFSTHEELLKQLLAGESD